MRLRAAAALPDGCAPATADVPAAAAELTGGAEEAPCGAAELHAPRNKATRRTEPNARSFNGIIALPPKIGCRPAASALVEAPVGR